MKRWFVKDETVAERRALEVQNARKRGALWCPRPGGGRKRNRVGGGVPTSIRMVMKVKVPTETWALTVFLVGTPQ